MKITEFNRKDQAELAEFVLAIQNGEFKLGFSTEEQPDLINTEQFYKSGGFWIVREDGKIIGSIGLQRLNSECGILRKLFVDKEKRGSELNIAQRLFDRLLSEAQSLKLKYVILDTPSVAKASHKFYLKNAFKEITKADILYEFKYPERNSRLFRLTLN
ncbi:MAG: GNAT family N-acetyltransferase [Crocinitomicaceae bacterium]|nr:GNAT family N-acetyltransferase [Crocinitomicaceae bacterium]|tara:strand:- start:4292 stop:4768 length:477 start_codon:yes stop_codon:yes gene_type:complete